MEFFALHIVQRMYNARSNNNMVVGKSKQFALTIIFAAAILLCGASAVDAQVDDICGEFGFIPSLDGPRLSAPYIYGKVNITTADTSAKAPKVSIVYLNRGQTPNRQTVSKTGNYCFRVTGGAGGTLIIDIDGVEVARRPVSNFGTAQQREDFDISISAAGQQTAGGVVASKYYYPPTKKTAEFYKQAAEAEAAKDLAAATNALQAVVKEDAKDYIGWGLLAGVLLERKMLVEADAAVRRSLELKVEYAPAWLTAGRIRTAQTQYAAAIEIFKHAATLEPENARVYQLLGEAYLLAKQGTLGAEALNKAIELDPLGMAELHLQLAHLYQLAKAPALAAAEYKKFLAKVPDHPDKAKFEKFIKENP